MNASNGLPSGLRWDARGTPFSVEFNDQYFCQDNGYEEAVHVCCEGNHLRERFSALDPYRAGTFTIIETGFGTGLDLCCAWQLWEASAPESWTLHFISVERYPLAAADVARALALWPQLAGYREVLIARYEPRPGEVMAWSFPERRLRLTIVFEDVVRALVRIKREGLAPDGADAFFLDGFAPSKNPGMWAEEVFLNMAPLSREGTTCSTFTVAGAVRRGLQASGFELRKVAGHGRKKEILTGTFRGP
jgi:tRNA 5-methylaminomethyl-2-thiouridine biosynthesis bifunctional protein